jgi:hypothetical protein
MELMAQVATLTSTSTMAEIIEAITSKASASSSEVIFPQLEEAESILLMFLFKGARCTTLVMEQEETPTLCNFWFIQNQ